MPAAPGAALQFSRCGHRGAPLEPHVHAGGQHQQGQAGHHFHHGVADLAQQQCTVDAMRERVQRAVLVHHAQHRVGVRIDVDRVGSVVAREIKLRRPVAAGWRNVNSGCAARQRRLRRRQLLHG